MEKDDREGAHAVAIDSRLPRLRFTEEYGVQSTSTINQPQAIFLLGLLTASHIPTLLHLSLFFVSYPSHSSTVLKSSDDLLSAHRARP